MELDIKAHGFLRTSIFLSLTYIFHVSDYLKETMNMIFIINTVRQKMFASFKNLVYPYDLKKNTNLLFAKCFYCVFFLKSYTEIREESFLILFGVFLMRYTVQKSSMASTNRKFKLNG